MLLIILPPGQGKLAKLKKRTRLKYRLDDIRLKTSEDRFEKVVTETLGEAWTRDPFDRISIAQENLSKPIS